MPIKDPYWLIRSRAFLLEIPIFGEKSTIKQNIEILLFNLNNNNSDASIETDKIIPSKNESKLKASIDLFERKYGRGENYDINSKKFFNFRSYLIHRVFARL
jgi:hypothetical protein